MMAITTSNSTNVKAGRRREESDFTDELPK
jgi:hypothetical protein